MDNVISITVGNEYQMKLVEKALIAFSNKELNPDEIHAKLLEFDGSESSAESVCDKLTRLEREVAVQHLQVIYPTLSLPYRIGLDTLIRVLMPP